MGSRHCCRRQGYDLRWCQRHPKCTWSKLHHPLETPCTRGGTRGWYDMIHNRWWCPVRFLPATSLGYPSLTPTATASLGSSSSTTTFLGYQTPPDGSRLEPPLQPKDIETAATKSHWEAYTLWAARSFYSYPFLLLLMKFSSDVFMLLYFLYFLFLYFIFSYYCR